MGGEDEIKWSRFPETERGQKKEKEKEGTTEREIFAGFQRTQEARFLFDDN